jgi:glucose/arabinose dehydrogenase
MRAQSLRWSWLLVAISCCSGRSRADEPIKTTNAQADASKGTCFGAIKLGAWVSDPKLCVYVFAEQLNAVRQMAFAKNGDLFVNNGRISVLWDQNHDGTSGADERSVFAQAAGLNHGLVFSPDQRFLYASSDSTVYRFAYTSGARKAAQPAELVIKDIPTGGHSTRSLVFDSHGRLYVSVGSANNVDSEPNELRDRSQVRRFELPNNLPRGGLSYASGTPIATGMRNEVGLFIDPQDRMWGVENGRDNAFDPDFGGDIHDDNPGEEINLIDGQGASFYGYPFCYSEFKVHGGQGAGVQWADQTLPAQLQKTDAYCRDRAKVHPPLAVFQAHSAPLGILQYSGHALPYAGDLIISAHGSWNRRPAVGRVILRARIANGAVTTIEPIVGEKSWNGDLAQGDWGVRPVDVRQGPDDAIYVSDDLGGRVLKIGYRH